MLFLPSDPVRAGAGDSQEDLEGPWIRHHQHSHRLRQC